MTENQLQTNVKRENLHAVIHSAELADSTKAQYTKALDNYLNTGAELWDAHALAAYAQSQKKSTRAFLKASVRLVTEGAALALKADASPENIAQVQAGLYRIEALQSAISAPGSKGEKAHTWLSAAKVKELMSTCDDSLTGRRDWVVLALLVGAGLRRQELVNLRFDDIQEQYRKDGSSRMVLDVKGKGAKDRVVPISDDLARGLLEWQEIAGDGLIARSLGRKKELGGSISVIGVFNIARKHGAMIGKPELAPHDLRRTYAQLGFDAGVPITQISKLLGHASVATTQRYLNLELDIEATASDFIPLK